MTESRAVRAKERARRRLEAFRFGVLSITIVLSLAIVIMATPHLLDRMQVQIAITLPLVAAVYVVSRRVAFLVAGVGLSALATATGVRAVIAQDDSFLLLDLGLRITFLLLTAGWVTVEVVRAREISRDTIVGGITVYLLVGFTFGLLYQMCAIALPGAFASATMKIPDSDPGHHALESLGKLLYFSFTTLTTVAYGDITPARPETRLLCMAEGMIGQLFPAVFIARLVGLHVAQRHPGDA